MSGLVNPFRPLLIGAGAAGRRAVYRHRFALLAFFASRGVYTLAAMLSDAPADSLADAFCRFDCEHYLDAAARGYASEFAWAMERDGALWAFFPLYPLLVKIASEALFLSPLYAGLLVSHLAFLGALILFGEFIRAELGESDAARGVFVLAFVPVSFYFSSAYSESLFLFLLLAVFMLCQNKRWLAAGLCAAFLSATRAAGVFIVFPMLLYLAREPGFIPAALRLDAFAMRRLAAVSLAPLGAFLWMAYLHFSTGDALAFIHVQTLWYRAADFPWRPFLDFMDPARGWHALNPIYTLIALAGVAVVAWRKRYEVALFAALQVILPLIYGYQSYSRYLSVVFALPFAVLLLARGRAIPVWIFVIALAALNFFLIFLWFREHGLLV
jgi:hypothetical protein